MIFKISRKGYTDARQIYKKGTIDIKPGITVLIGCNGSGKTTLLREIEESAHSLEIPVYFYNNLTVDVQGEAFLNQDFGLVSQIAFSSEGERITLQLTHKVDEIAYILHNGKKKKSKLADVFSSLSDTPEETKEITKDRILLFDAIDSGLSIDQVRDIKEYLFKQILDVYDNEHLYIIVSANEYELCRSYSCFNVTESKYVTINSYDDYTNEILRTRMYKEQQIDKLIEKEKKRGK